MEEKKPSRFEKFFAGKGFYIVLALCIAVIGISVWSILGGGIMKNAPDGTGIALDKPTSAVTDGADSEGVPPDVNGDGIKDTVVDIDESLEDVANWSSEGVITEPAVWLWPVSGELERNYTIDALAYDVTMADWRTHDGIDIAVEAGAVVRSAADGIVESVEQDDLYGTTVTIAHNGGIKTVYSNLEGTPTVQAGDEVKAGDVIGSVGDTAICEIGEPSHLHFSMSRNGESLNPSDYLPE